MIILIKKKLFRKTYLILKTKEKNLIENLLLKNKNMKEKENEIINDINQFQIQKIIKKKLFLIYIFYAIIIIRKLKNQKKLKKDKKIS
jgi:hypothetical protein